MRIRWIWTSIAILALGAALACDSAELRGATAAPAETPAPHPAIELDGSAPVVAGSLHGRAFHLEAARLENGILSLRQGTDFFADRELMVFLFLDDREIPAERRFEVGSTPRPGALTPHLHLKWREGAEGLPETHIVMGDYQMTLAFGAMAGRTLPGSITLEIPGQPGTRLAGRFEADVNGLIVTDGVPDLGVDSFDVLHYVAERYVTTHRPELPLSDLHFGNGRFTHEDPDNPTLQVGSIEVGLPSGELWRLLFAKRDGAWKVERRLSHAQFVDAHPIEVPPPDARPWERFRYVMARVLESEVAAVAASEGIYDARFRSTYKPNDGVGEGLATYRIGLAGEPVERRFLFEKRESGWALVRELAVDESI